MRKPGKLIRFMNLHKINIKNSHFLIFGLFLVFHLALFNINAVEWGDSYRILRASEYIREFKYPSDEKRPPLYSVVLALRPNVDQVFWGRVVMLAISIINFVIFYKLCTLYFDKNSRALNLALLLFAFNPVYFYWSLRIYADVFLSFFVLLTFYLLTKWKTKLTLLQLVTLGILAALSVMARFEGYLLFASLGVGIFFSSGFNLKNLQTKIINSAVYFGACALILLPYLYFRNPLTSTYISETSGHKFDIPTLVTYFLSLLFVLGFVYAFYFIFSNKHLFLKFVDSNLGLVFYTVLNLTLVFFWPSAVPRLFVSGIPFLILLSTGQLADFFENKKVSYTTYFILALLLAIYFVGQEYYRLQFLVPNRNAFLIMASLQFVLLVFLLLKKFKPFVFTLVLALVFWTFITVYLHKEIYLSIKQASEYSQANLQGKIAYNDVSSVSDWYLNEKSKDSHVSGTYVNFDDKSTLQLSYLQKNKINYLMITNEHDPNLVIDLKKRPYLNLVRTFSYTSGGKVFFTKVVKVGI